MFPKFLRGASVYSLTEPPPMAVIPRRLQDARNAVGDRPRLSLFRKLLVWRDNTRQLWIAGLNIPLESRASSVNG